MSTKHNANCSRSVVTEINRNVAATLKACGPAILAQGDFMKEVVTVISTIITRSHPCQQDLGDEDEEQEEVEGSSEYDWLVIDTALDVIIGLAVALGPAFAELWKIFEKPILKFAASESENIERSTAVGVIAECAANMEAAVSPYTEKLLKLLLKRLSDTDPETKSNAAYATGQLIYHSTDSNTYLPHYTTILQKLESMLPVREARTKDNAAGCLTRMILAHPDRIPLGDVLPALVDLLPLKDDYEENAPVYKCIYKLCKLLPRGKSGRLNMTNKTQTRMASPRSSSSRPSSSPSSSRSWLRRPTSSMTRLASLFARRSSTCTMPTGICSPTMSRS